MQILQMVCPFCRLMLGDTVIHHRASELVCSCIMHQRCFHRYFAGRKRLLCPTGHHLLTGEVVASSIDLRGLADEVMSSGQQDEMMRKMRKMRKIQRMARTELPVVRARFLRQAVESATSVQGVRHFLHALYGTLLDATFRVFGVTDYSLIWYPQGGEEVAGYGYIGDNAIPWQRLDHAGVTVETMPVPITLPSSQVQLRVKFQIGQPMPAAKWNEVRGDLRTNIGCVCSEPWKYKIARMVEAPGGKWIYDAYPENHPSQIHGEDTWVLSLDLSDVIHRCKHIDVDRKVDVGRKAVEAQIALTNKKLPPHKLLRAGGVTRIDYVCDVEGTGTSGPVPM